MLVPRAVSWWPNGGQGFGNDQLANTRLNFITILLHYQLGEKFF